MKITKFDKKYQGRFNLVEMEEGTRKGWVFPDKDVIASITKRLTRWTTSCKVIAPMNGQIKIVYRVPGEKVFVIDEPRLPFFSLMMHKHGKQFSTVDEEYRCMRCGEEVPAAVKSLVMIESTFGLDVKENK